MFIDNLFIVYKLGYVRLSVIIVSLNNCIASTAAGFPSVLFTNSNMTFINFTISSTGTGLSSDLDQVGKKH